jgi:C4-dicarboxylate-specific signal transduction histidine kinase
MTRLAPPTVAGNYLPPSKRLRRAGQVALVAICKLSLLFAMFGSRVQIVEQFFENVEQQQNVETACKVEGQALSARSGVVQRLVARKLNRGSHLQRSRDERVQLGSCPTTGHRLANGICAPQLC